jgi:hypothetical protein
MTFKLSSLLYKSALIQQEIESEQLQRRPDWLRVMRLKTLRLKLADRLRAVARQAAKLGLASSPVPLAG